MGLGSGVEVCTPLRFFFLVALRQVAVLGLTLSLEGVCSASGVALGTCFPRTGQALSWGFWLAS